MSSSRLILVFLAAVAPVMLTGCLSPAEHNFNGIQFESHAGQDATSDLTWILENPIRWSMDNRNGEYTAVISPPCATVQAPAEMTSTEIRVDMNRAAIAAIACEEPLARMDKWVHTFIGETISYTWDGDELTMTNDNGSLTFERAKTL
jgi:hypothetical protein